MATSTNSSYASYQMLDANGAPLGNPSVRDHLQPYLRRWPWYLASLALALGAAYAYLLYKQPVYRTEASLMLQDEKRGNTQDNPLKELETYSPKKAVENELEVLRSSTIMGRVVDQLHLDARYYRPARFGKREIYDDAPVWVLVENGTPDLYKTRLALSFPDSQTVRIDEKTYPLNQSLKTPLGQIRIMPRQSVGSQTEPVLVQVMPRSAAVAHYRNAVKAEPTSKTSSVVRLTLEDPVPAKGEAVLNYLIREYNQAAIVDKNRVAANTMKFVEDRLRKVAGELSSVERNVEQYKSTQGITDLGTQAQSFLQTAQQNDAQLNQVTIQLAVLNELQKFLNSQGNKRGTTPSTVGLSDPVLLGQIDKLAQLELQRDQLSLTTSAENPLLQSLDTQIKSTKANIGQNVQTMKTALTSSREQYQAKNDRLETQIRAVPVQERALMDITRQQGIKNSLYTYLLQKREELAVTFAASIADTRTIDAAESTASPVKPVSSVIFALFGLVGLLVPTGFIAGRNALNTRVTRRNDVEGATQVPILGEVMHKRHRDVLVVGPQNRSVIAEQIRTIRTNLNLGREDLGESQVVLFTSSISGEGKSFVSLNLGASLAMLKEPTVILEMDLRMPRLHQAFGIDNSVGLSDYLNGEATLTDILKPVPGYPNYYLIPSGPLPPDPSEMLSGSAVKTLIRTLREQFRYVLIDAPPVGLVTDAQVIAPLADATLFVVRHGVTPKQSLRMLDTYHREGRFRNLNIVLNAVGSSGDAYHFNGRYRNSYAYK